MFLVLFSQASATGTDLSGWASLAGSVANIGFAAAVGIYLLTKALPQMQDNFRSELKATREAGEQAIKETRVEHRESLRAVVEHCEKESVRHSDTFRVEMGLVAKALEDQSEVLEEVRDALRELKAELTSRKA